MTGEDEDKAPDGPLDGLDTEGFSAEEIAALNEPAGEEKPPEPAAAETKPEEGEKTAGGEEETYNPAEKAPEGFVPYQSLAEMRKTNKELRNQLDEIGGWQRQVMEKLAEHRSGQAEPAKPDDAVPDVNEDPLAAIQYLMNERREAQQNEQATAQQTEQAQQTQRLIDEAAMEFDAAAAKDESLNQAYQHLRNAKVREMEAWGMHPYDIQQQLQQYVSQTVVAAKQRGISVTDIVRNLAQTHGWQAEALKDPEPKPEEAKEKVERMKEAVNAAQTLSGGGDAKQDMTIDDLLSLPGDELDALAMENPELFEKLAASA